MSSPPQSHEDTLAGAVVIPASPRALQHADSFSASSDGEQAESPIFDEDPAIRNFWEYPASATAAQFRELSLEEKITTMYAVRERTGFFVGKVWLRRFARECYDIELDDNIDIPRHATWLDSYITVAASRKGYIPSLAYLLEDIKATQSFLLAGKADRPLAEFSETMRRTRTWIDTSVEVQCFHSRC